MCGDWSDILFALAVAALSCAAYALIRIISKFVGCCNV